MKHAARWIFTLVAAVVFSGCTNIYWRNSINISDEILGLRLAGRWSRDGYEPNASNAVIRDELLFNADGTFSYARIWPDLPLEQRRTFTGTWVVTDGNLIQYWRKPSGRIYRTSTSTLLEMRPREIVFRDGGGPVVSFHRRARPEVRSPI